MLLDDIAQQVKSCNKCVLCSTRINTVFSSGDPKAKIMLIGEAPGEEEDKQGSPFVGASGWRLNSMIEICLGLKREQVYIANIIKCRPPNNRPPEQEEIRQCFGYLQQQIILVQPTIIVTLGRTATHTLLGINDPITKIRGKKFLYGDIVVVPTTHPSYWLRKPSDTFNVIEDMELVRGLIA